MYKFGCYTPADCNNSPGIQALVSFKKYMPPPLSSLLQGKHLPFSPSPLRFNIFRLFVILSLTQLYRYTLKIFKGALATILTKKIMFWKLVNSFKMMK
jgi:hypothetical protein